MKLPPFRPSPCGGKRTLYGQVRYRDINLVLEAKSKKVLLCENNTPPIMSKSLLCHWLDSWFLTRLHSIEGSALHIIESFFFTIRTYIEILICCLNLSFASDALSYSRPPQLELGRCRLLKSVSVIFSVILEVCSVFRFRFVKWPTFSVIVKLYVVLLRLKARVTEYSVERWVSSHYPFTNNTNLMMITIILVLAQLLYSVIMVGMRS